MKKFFLLFLVLLFALHVNALTAISGTFTICAGSTTYLSDATTGGTWASSNTAVATVGSTGIVYGAAAGTSTITYTVGASYVTVPVVVNPMPSSITGFGTLCTGSTLTLSDGTSGGTWTSDEPTIASVGATTGIVSGLLPGTAELVYTLPGGCYTTTHDTVVSAIDAITGTLTTCVGYTTTLADGTGGGVWVSGSDLVATVGSTTGIVTGVAAGTATISYTATSTCGSGTVMQEVHISAAISAGSISGSSTMYLGAVDRLYDGVGGGTWSSSTTAVATVGSTSGAVFGVAPGTATITYSVLGCSGTVFTTFVVTVLDSVGPFIGPISFCAGSTASFYDSLSEGGTWVSSNTAVATIRSTSGFLTAISPGTSIISYVLSGVAATSVITVLAAPGAITGSTPLCVGATATFTDATAGGTWASGDSFYATVGSGTGTVTGVNDGVVNISYLLPDGCYTQYLLTIGSLIVPNISAFDSSFCAGASVTFSDVMSGGVWISGNPAVATVGSASGIVTGVAAGATIISYGITGACGFSYATLEISVSSTTDTAVISGSLTAYVGLNSYLSGSVSGGAWTSSDPAVATINTSTGELTGVAVGTTTISYAVTGCGGTVITTTVVSVAVPDVISGWVIFPGGYTGSLTVWLIDYNPTTLLLEASDSLSLYSFSDSATLDSVHYQFVGMGTDSFRVKAAIYDSMTSTTSFVPTYHTSYFYWHDANVIYHTLGTVNQYQDIMMFVGVSTSGPGFIGGNVMTGANKGTSGSVPVENLLMVCTTSAGTVYQQTYTDASGNYSFTDLPLDTYTVHPEAINYLSTDYTGITLTATSDSTSAANFIEHTKSHTIAPGDVSVTNAAPLSNVVTLYPNPTAGMVQISWRDNTTETGTVVITDIAGHQLYVAPLLLTAGSGQTQVDLSNLPDGVYLVSVRSAGINYNGKIVFER